MESCRKRLKHYSQAKVLSKVFNYTPNYFYELICVIDFEATCDKNLKKDDDQEIIEFPAVAVDVKNKKIVISSLILSCLFTLLFWLFLD
jgi:putative uncharacterized protein LOC548900